MKVTVKDYLNVRVGKPSLGAPTYQYLAPGSILEVDGKLYDGDKFEGSSKWLKDEAGNYYWAGGVTIPVITAIDPAAYNYWHLKNYNIKDLHDKGFTGNNTTICVVDSGIAAAHSGFDYSKISGSCFLKQNITTNYTDTYGHGSKCAGIIAANGQKIIGIAFEANLIAYKGYSNEWSKEADLIYALENVPSGCDVVSVSYSLANNSNITRLQNAITRLHQNNTIVVASNGNPGDPRNLLTGKEGVISVGSVDQNGNYSGNNSTIGGIDILAPGVNIQTTFLNNSYGADSGTSFATPFVASVCALLKQKNKNHNATSVLDLLKSTGNFTTDQKYKIINPLKCFS
jgi:subtilisin family serine protease